MWDDQWSFFSNKNLKLTSHISKPISLSQIFPKSLRQLLPLSCGPVLVQFRRQCHTKIPLAGSPARAPASLSAFSLLLVQYLLWYKICCILYSSLEFQLTWVKTRTLMKGFVFFRLLSIYRSVPSTHSLHAFGSSWLLNTASLSFCSV